MTPMLPVRGKAILALAIFLVSQSVVAAPKERATRIVVDKSDHLMHVYRKDKIIAVYRVGFGTSPVGHKQQEGDRRTPEGHYKLDYKNAKSTFFKSIHISYPNASDRANARRLGVKPQSTELKRMPQFFRHRRHLVLDRSAASRGRRPDCEGFREQGGGQ